MGKRKQHFLHRHFPLQVSANPNESRLPRPPLGLQANGSQMMQSVAWRDYSTWLECLNAQAARFQCSGLELFADPTQGSAAGSRTLRRQHRFGRFVVGDRT